MVASKFAVLRSLTLPAGITTGQRIELDGINGEIRIYDSNNDLLFSLSPDGLIVYDGDGNTRLSIGTLFETAYSVLSLWSAAFEETTQGLLSLTDYDKTNRMVLAPGQQSSKGSLEWCLESTAYDNTLPSLLQAVALTLDDAASPRPIIDLTGASCPAETQYPHTVAYDVQYGTPNQFHEAPNSNGSYPRGVICVGERTTALNYEAEATVLTAPSCELISGRRYKISISYRALAWGTAVANGISLIKVRDTAGGTIRLEDHKIVISGSAQAGGSSFTILDCPADRAAGTYTPVLTAQRALGGAGTHTISATAQHPITLIVEDVGATTNT
jgi:hypothetical protein